MDRADDEPRPRKALTPPGAFGYLEAHTRMS